MSANINSIKIPHNNDYVVFIIFILIFFQIMEKLLYVFYIKSGDLDKI